MARGKQMCQNTGIHQMSEFSVTRRNKKKKQTITVSGIRCKWCKKADGRPKREIIND